MVIPSRIEIMALLCGNVVRDVKLRSILMQKGL